MSSKYRNLLIRPLAAAPSSAAAPSAFLSFLSFDFFSLKFMLWGTCAERHGALKTGALKTGSSPPLGKHARPYFFKAHFQVVLRLLLIVRKRLVDEKLLFNVDLSRKKKLVGD